MHRVKGSPVWSLPGRGQLGTVVAKVKGSGGEDPSVPSEVPAQGSEQGGRTRQVGLAHAESQEGSQPRSGM